KALAELAESFQGYAEGARAVLTASRKGDLPAGFRPLLEALRVPPGLEAAGEGAVGSAARAVVGPPGGGAPRAGARPRGPAGGGAGYGAVRHWRSRRRARAEGWRAGRRFAERPEYAAGRSASSRGFRQRNSSALRHSAGTWSGSDGRQPERGGHHFSFRRAID